MPTYQAMGDAYYETWYVAAFPCVRSSDGLVVTCLESAAENSGGKWREEVLLIIIEGTRDARNVWMLSVIFSG